MKMRVLSLIQASDGIDREFRNTCDWSKFKSSRINISGIVEQNSRVAIRVQAEMTIPGKFPDKFRFVPSDEGSSEACWVQIAQ